jgi:hypothetical protein
MYNAAYILHLRAITAGVALLYRIQYLDVAVCFTNYLSLQCEPLLTGRLLILVQLLLHCGYCHTAVMLTQRCSSGGAGCVDYD